MSAKFPRKMALEQGCDHRCGFRKGGFFFRKSTCKSVQRFRCRNCGKTRSSATDHPCKWQKKRQINPRVHSYLVEGMALRGISRVLGITRNTVARKKRFLAQRAQERLEKAMVQILPGSIKSIQFDELISYEQNKCKPLSVSVLMIPDGRKFFDFDIASFRPPTPRLAEISKKKYGYRPDTRGVTMENLLQKLAPKLAADAVIETDECPWYGSKIKKILPQTVTHRFFKGRRARSGGQGELKEGGYDPLFSINHTFAMMRARMSRLIKQTWNTTKDPQRLVEHLMIYADHHNRVLTVQKGN